MPPRAIAGGSVVAKRAALATASPIATKAGLAVLQSGGTAADAAVAVACALAVVHPHAGNLGGGGFLVYYDASTKAVWTLDFRETAPKAATRELFEKLPDLRSGGLAAGVPGTVAGLDAMHRKFGTKPWKELLAPAIALAREGAAVDGELARAIAAARNDRKLDPLPHAEPEKPLPMPELAAALQRLADAGAGDFYRGQLAKKVVQASRQSGGIIGFRDLREYEPVWRAPLRLRYGAYDVYATPPPSGGGLVIGTVLNIVGGDDLGALGFQTPASLHLLAEAQRRAFIDRDRHVGDPAAARIPYRELLSHERASQWRKSIRPDRITGTATLVPPQEVAVEGEQTTHFTIVDAAGNVASLTTSLGDHFGGGTLAGGLGFFLNNAMVDFTSGANALNPGKRPASSMSPVIVLHDGKPFLALGTRGGASIPTSILQVFLNVAAHGMSLADAVAAPRFHQQAIPDEIVYEQPLASPQTIRALNAMGHAVSPRVAIGDVHAILFENDRLVAVADPRSGGAAGGF